jgi:HEPN domain-containing protein
MGNDRLKDKTRQAQISYWLESANHDFDVAVTLFQNQKYDWCLFIGHLAIALR